MLEIKFAALERASLCINPKKKYISPTSPPSGINKYAIRYVIINSKFNLDILGDWSVYLAKNIFNKKNSIP